VADVEWFEQIRRFGWTCEALGQPMRAEAGWLTALHIRIDDDTPALLRANGIYHPLRLSLTTRRGEGADQ
jgi:N-acyl-L-homoserine lactone synthetase